MEQTKSIVSVLSKEITTTSQASEVFTQLAQMTPRDMAIAIVSSGLDKKLKEFATAHLDTCQDCVKYLNTSKDLAVIKVERNTAVYDWEGDTVYGELKAAADKAAVELKEYKNSVEPSYYKTTHFYKSTKV